MFRLDACCSLYLQIITGLYLFYALMYNGRYFKVDFMIRRGGFD